MTLPPIVTKITPPLRRLDTLRRDRLLNFLHEHIDRKLQFVSAGAGYGKTTLLADFVCDTDLACCWYSLDPADRELRIFGEYLLASLGRTFPGFGQRTRRVLEDPVPLSDRIRELVGALINEMVEIIPEWFILVLDDFHHVEDSADVCTFLSAFLAYQPEHCHLIVASRAIPTVPAFVAAAARGEAVALTQDDLRFTPDEVRDFLMRDPGVYVVEREAGALSAACEGWITGILLTRHTPQRSLLESMSRARRSGRPLYDYLAAEVLDQQDAATRDFLLASSTLNELSAPICQTLLDLPSAQEMLERSERGNLFLVRLDGMEPPRFRYHTLFREFLQDRFRVSDPHRFRSLHRRAATWLAQEGQTDLALRHALEAGDPDEAARILDGGAWEMVQTGRLAALAEWAGWLPEEVLRSYPRLLRLIAKAAAGSGQPEQSARWLSWAEEAFRRQGDRSQLALTLAAQALWAVQRGAAESALELARQAVALEVDLEAAVESRRVLGLALNQLGRFAEAAPHLEIALDGSRALNDHHREVLILGSLAYSLGMRGRLEEAIRTQETAVAIARQLGSLGYLSEALNDLGAYFGLVGNYAAALEAADEALHVAREVGHPGVEMYALLSLGALLRDLGELEEAVETLEEGERLARMMRRMPLVAWAQEAQALVHLQRGDYGRAVELVRSALAVSLPSDPDHGRFEASLGAAWVEGGETESGLEQLRLACERLDRESVPVESVRARLLAATVLQRAGLPEARTFLAEALQNSVAQGLAVLPIVPHLDELLEWAAEEEGEAGPSAGLLRAMRERMEAARQMRIRLRPAPPAPRPSFRFYGFGVGRVERNDAPIPASAWESTRARYLLFYLLIHSPCTRDQIGEAMWPDMRLERLPGNLHNTKYRIQCALGAVPFTFDDGLYRVSETLDYWFDVHEFERLIRRAQGAPFARAVHYLTRAIELYQGDFLCDCYDDWCVDWRERLQQQFLAAVTRLAGWLIERGRFDRAIEVLQRGLAMDDLREDFHRQLMQAYASQGQPDAALAQYRRCRRALQRELGVDPAPETEALVRRIRNGQLNPPGTR